MPDAHANFAYSLVATAPSPATNGTSLVVTSAEGALFPAVPFNAVICPAGTAPTSANAEVVRVTARSTDTLTITRAQESSSARTVVVGDQIFAAVTAKTLTDIEPAAVMGPPIVIARSSDTAARNSGNTGSTLTADDTLLFAIGGSSGRTWMIEMFLFFNGANVTMDAKASFTVPSGSTIKGGYGFVAGSAGFPGSPASAASYGVTAPLAAAGPWVWATGTGADVFARGEAYLIEGGTSGNVVLNWAQNTSDAGNLVLNKGSFLRATRLV